MESMENMKQLEAEFINHHNNRHIDIENLLE